MNRFYKIIKYALYLSFLSFVIFFILLINNPQNFWLYIENNKLIPRIIAWTSLIFGLYGIARRRFSPTITVFFFFIAFFFAYLGRFFFRSMY